MQSLFVREENRLGKNVIVGIYSLTGIFGSLVGICYRITGVAAVRKLSCVFVAASGTDGAIFIMKNIIAICGNIIDVTAYCIIAAFGKKLLVLH